MKKIIILGLVIFAIIIGIKLSVKLDGMTFVFLGDSLIEGYGNDNKGVDYYLSEYLPNSMLINNSKSGSTITDNTGTDNIILINQIKSLEINPDIIIFNGGANDIMGYALEYLNNDLKKEIGIVDPNLNNISGDTVIGDLEEAIIEMQKEYPEAKLCYVQMFLMDDATINIITNDEEKKLEIKKRRNEFYGQIEILCQKRNVDYIDVTDKFVGTGTKYRQDDGIHLRENGYKLIVPYILDELKKII